MIDKYTMYKKRSFGQVSLPFGITEYQDCSLIIFLKSQLWFFGLQFDWDWEQILCNFWTSISIGLNLQQFAALICRIVSGGVLHWFFVLLIAFELQDFGAKWLNWLNFQLLLNCPWFIKNWGFEQSRWHQLHQ